MQRRIESISRQWILGLPALRFILVATIIAWLPALAIGSFVAWLFPGPSPAIYPIKSLFDVIVLGLILAPIIETQVMRGCFFLLRKCGLRLHYVTGITALLFASLHYPSIDWGIHALWSFGVMGYCYSELEKHSVNRAVLVTTVIHALFNALSYCASCLQEWLV